MSQGLVIPCYNESKRLPVQEIDALLEGCQDLTILLVDDGSSDGTGNLITQLSQSRQRLKVLILPQNQGKAEAVRAGMNELMIGGFKWIGYADADFAAPAYEIMRLLQIARARQPQVLLGSRVKLLGTNIERRMFRHYLGRVFATFASMALNIPVYDTQCGAKFFATTDTLKSALSSPFTSRWSFDVELIGRLLGSGQVTVSDFVEVPLLEWRDIKGSKLKLTAMLKAGLDLLAIGWKLRCAQRSKPSPK